MVGADRAGASKGADDPVSHSRPAKSYYDLYPERKRTGPYVPKHALVAHDGNQLNENRQACSSDSSIRRSRSGSQLGSYHSDQGKLNQSRPVSASSRPHKTPSQDNDRSGPTQRAGPSLSVTSSAALRRLQSQEVPHEPIKSIEEIVRTHSTKLLTVPTSERGPQRSVSWSAFERHPSEPYRAGLDDILTTGEISDSESVASESSVERETRTLLQNMQDERLEWAMSRLSIWHADPEPVHVQRQSRKKHASPVRSPPSKSQTISMPSDQRGLTRCVRITVPGAAGVQVSFADVGAKGGQPVMVFLGLGASRHLVGLYDELASTLNLRLVCIDRWGIGRTEGLTSDARTILGWSLIVEQVADLLGIDRFSVLAHSAGAPFAAAVALLLPHRILGPLHLLAPWTGVQQDSAYRWLRYVPDSVIKTAQVAEWIIQGWKLNKEGPRAASKTPPIAVEDEASTAGRRDEPRGSDRGPIPPPKDRQLPTSRSALEIRSDAFESGTSRSSRARGEEPGWTARNAVDMGRPDMSNAEDESTSTNVERETALGLLKASHAESARGRVDDLNLILGKRPWGFGYADVHVDCEVWHGSKDERIPLSSSINLSKEMPNCTLHIVDGAGHSLMTNTKVVVEVFESIRKLDRL